MTAFVLLLVAVLLQAFDQWSTLVLLQHGGVEASPIPVWCISAFGASCAVIGLKTLAVGLVCGIYWLCRGGEKAARILGLVNAYYLILLGWFNFRYILRVI